MYSIKVRGDFSSAHNLDKYHGKCENLHGHNWKVEVEIASRELGGSGMVMDFKAVKAFLEKILERLDHKYVNELPYFKNVNPTSENIAAFIFNELKKDIPIVKSVTVWETDTSQATYSE